MLRIFLDTNIVNEIADTNGFLELLLQAHQGGAFEIISHDVVKAELEQTADPARRQLLVDTWERIPKRPVPAQGGFYGAPLRYDESLYGDGSHTGIFLKQALTTGRGRFVDAIIAVTAAGEADVLATTDPVLPKRIAASQVACKVWGPDELKAFLEQANTHIEVSGKETQP